MMTNGCSVGIRVASHFDISHRLRAEDRWEVFEFARLCSQRDLEVAEVCSANGESFGSVSARFRVKMGEELHMSKDAWRFTPTSEMLTGDQDPRDTEIAGRLLVQGYLVLHEGRRFGTTTIIGKTVPATSCP